MAAAIKVSFSSFFLKHLISLCGKFQNSIFKNAKKWHISREKIFVAKYWKFFTFSKRNHLFLFKAGHKKKCLKVNIYFVISFIQKQVVPFWKGEKLPIFCYKYFFTWKMWFFWRFWPKNWNGWSHNIETCHKEKSGVLEKN